MAMRLIPASILATRLKSRVGASDDPLRILSGKMADDIQVVRHFPFRIGRSAENNLRLDEAGVWIATSRLNFRKTKASR